MKLLTKTALPMALMAVAAAAGAQDFPGSRPISIVVPFAAGGPTDLVARQLADALRKPLGGAAIVIENAAGAGGTIGANKVAKASADGHTLLLHHIGVATAPALYRKLPYKTLVDFEYLGMVNEVPMTVIARPTLPADSYAELARWLKANKGKINLANAGLGAASHLCGMLLQSALKLEMTTVAYKGTGPAMTDLIGGQVDLMCDQTTNTSSQIEGRKVKAFAVTTRRRLTTPALKELPTMQEVGYRDFEVNVFHGLYAPKGVPAATLRKLNGALKVALKDPDFVRRQNELGAVIVTDKRVEPAEHRKFIAAQIDKWTPVIRAAGVYAD